MVGGYYGMHQCESCSLRVASNHASFPMKRLPLAWSFASLTSSRRRLAVRRLRCESLEDRRLLCDQFFTPGPIEGQTISGNLEYCMLNDPGPDGQGVYTLEGDLRVEGSAELTISPGVTLRVVNEAKLLLNPEGTASPRIDMDAVRVQVPVVVGTDTRGVIRNSDIDGGSLELRPFRQVSISDNRFFGDVPLLIQPQEVGTIANTSNLFSSEVRIGLIDSRYPVQSGPGAIAGSAVLPGRRHFGG